MITAPLPAPQMCSVGQVCSVQPGSTLIPVDLPEPLLMLQVKDDGYELAHDGNCITVFSAPNYCDQMGNKGAFITFTGGDMTPHFTQFAAVPHPDVKPMAYASSMMGNMWGF